MSVESEILRIQNNIAAAYAAVADKGGEVPLRPTSANLAAAVASIPAGGGFPSGGIIVWSGAANAIPTGWALCDGQNGTPDLRGRFVMGAVSGSDTNPDPDNLEYLAPGNTGGSKQHTMIIGEMPSHSHIETVADSSAKSPSSAQYASGSNVASSYLYFYSVTSAKLNTKATLNYMRTETAGSGKPFATISPYYTLCYIMKL